MNRILLIFATTLCLLLFAQSAKAVKILDEHIKVAGVGIGSSRAFAKERFGRELNINKDANPIFCNTETEIKYKGVKATFCGENLVNLICTSTIHQTPAGLRVGMAAQIAFDKYGTPEIQHSDELTKYYFRSTTSDSALVLHIKSSQIFLIELWCDFT